MIIIGIAGGTASGKTTFAHLLKDRLENASIISVDSYYKTLSQIDNAHSGVKLFKLDFDSPDSIEHPLLLEHLVALRNGQSIECPCYDFSTFLRRSDTLRIDPTDVIIVEGILTFYWKEIRDIFDYKIFIDASDEIRFKRRLVRDVQERGRTEDFVINQWNKSVQPGHARYCAPLKQYADYVISGELPINDMLKYFPLTSLMS